LQRSAQLATIRSVSHFSRRDVVQRAAGVVATLALLPLAARPAKSAATCADPASESLRESLHYAEAAPNPAQSCSACGFFSAGDGGCGSCTIMSGPVNSKGHCDSWSAKG
jgi:hypothetical protein